MVEAYILPNVVEQGLRTAVVFDKKEQLNIHQTRDLPGTTKMTVTKKWMG